MEIAQSYVDGYNELEEKGKIKLLCRAENGVRKREAPEEDEE